MERIRLERRPGWETIVERQGLLFHHVDGEIYWDESACYRFHSAEISELERATSDLHQLALAAVDHVIEKKRYAEFAIPPAFVPLIERSWEMDEWCFYGRFDFMYDGESPPKMLEYNADTPTALLESSVIQWYWLLDRFPNADQFNSIHEKLIARWKELGIDGHIHFACADGNLEDLGNVEYMRDTAIQAGFSTSQLYMEDIGLAEPSREFVDREGHPIRTMFKLYPWEWMAEEEFGRSVPNASWRVIEPAWKMILSNKSILPVLWELNPGHPNLLPASFEPRDLPEPYIQKPRFSREGANVTLYREGSIQTTQGLYGKEGYVYQSLVPAASFDGHFAVLGSWVIGDEPAGICIREDATEITTNTSRFVPHYFSE